MLGPSVARVDDSAVTLSAHRLRSLLAVLVLWRGQTLPAERIIDVLWQGSPSPGASNTLQGYVASLRRLLEPHRQARAASAVVIHEPGGYRLAVPSAHVDADRFESVVGTAHAFIQGLPDPMRPSFVGDSALAERLQADLSDSMRLWRGDAYGDLGDFTPASTERRRLEALRVDGRAASIVIDMALGRSTGAAAALEELVSAHPLREQLWGLWAVALVRNDRQAHALEVLQQLRTTLADELGIDPSPQIVKLQEDILRQDPSLIGTIPDTRTTAHPSSRTGEVKHVSSPALVPGPRLALPYEVPLVGRDRELALLKQGMQTAAEGHTRCFMLVGEGGVGKSRLTAELVRWVRQEELARIATVRSFDGDGAPPLWSLVTTFTELSRETGIDLPELARGGEAIDDEAAEAGRFALYEELAGFVRDVTCKSPLLLVVEDAHWSDPTTLRVLRHVVDRVMEQPLMVVVTCRTEGDTAAGADLASSIIRSGGTWLQLEGLEAEHVTELADHLALTAPSEEELTSIHERSGGNPLYVSELLKVAGLRDGQLPASLAGLVHRRLQTLTAETVLALNVAAVIGREFALNTVSRAMGDSGDLLHVLEPARLGGILREQAAGTWMFTHALVRDAVLDAMRPTERSSWHARIAASMDSVTHDARARSEVARHWRAAGAQYASQAWRSTAAAATRAHEVFAFVEEAELLAEALMSQRIDALSTDLERFLLLERRATACRLSSDWDEAATAVIEAIAVAERMQRPDLAAQAATSLPEGSVWHVQRYGTVSADLVHALQRCLALADPEDEALRCRLLLTIAGESFYISTPDELDALVDEALTIAESLQDPELHCLALQQAYSARWRPATVHWRVEAAATGVSLARAIGSLRFEATCGALHAIALLEAGRLDESLAVMGRTLDLAGRHGYTTVVVILELLRVPLKLLAGRDTEASASLSRVLDLQERITGSNLPAAVAGSQMLTFMWQGRAAEFVEAAKQLPPNQEAPIELIAVMALLRLGLEDAAHDLYSSMPTVEPDHTYMGMLVAATSAEVALQVGDRKLSDRMYRWLRPYSGGVASAGSTGVLGPVDAFIALAAAGSGRSDEACHHADAALEQCGSWGMSRGADWLTDLRSRYRF
ncbi:hypothetical protein ASG94_21140 [Nocardioides sp. Soil805]|nr:hypothetical protein ASG94_21140 [Nocardioides sp. Soil805]